ncbi:protein LIAT1-like [Myxocyprinus asiaticus]|uniref:protein LIAT1-like n=1 Tax=Myxocyprinus asiaticus TaxID=70543 RepID=UPI0022213F11|nr:protein LIAT1-like [Myxocyprinus asiaticus]
MATFRDRWIKSAFQATNMREEISMKKGFHVPPLTGATAKVSKKKRKQKKKSSSGINQSKDSEKHQMEQWTNEEMSDVQNKGRAKAKDQKNCKSQNPKVISEEAPAPTVEDKSDETNQGQDSLRWEGVLEDPVAEAQRLEVYRANRHKRYMASRQVFLQNISSSKLNA